MKCLSLFSGENKKLFQNDICQNLYPACLALMFKNNFVQLALIKPVIEDVLVPERTHRLLCF